MPLWYSMTDAVKESVIVPATITVAQPEPKKENHMANILVDVEKDVTVAAADLLHFIAGAKQVTPAATAALGVLLGATETAVSAVAADASQPLTIVISGVQQVQEFVAVWSDLKAFALSLGIKL